MLRANNIKIFKRSLYETVCFRNGLIKIYYETAPAIIEKINKLDRKDEIYNEIYSKIVYIVDLIETKKYDDAVCEYVRMMFWAEKL